MCPEKNSTSIRRPRQIYRKRRHKKRRWCEPEVSERKTKTNNPEQKPKNVIGSAGAGKVTT